MRKMMSVFCVLAALLLTSAVWAGGSPKFPADRVAYSPSVEKEILSKAGTLTIPFLENRGQLGNSRVRFYARTFAGPVLVEGDGLAYVLSAGGSGRLTVHERLVGARQTDVVGTRPSGTRVGIARGSDPGQWTNDLPAYEELSFGEVYDRVRYDLKVRGKNIEKIFVVEAGGDPGRIAMAAGGAIDLRVIGTGELEMETGKGPFRMTAPVAYQEIDGKRVKVDVAYAVRPADYPAIETAHVYGFEVGDYDRTRDLVIDPLLAWTFLGGSGDDRAVAVAVGANGNIYVAGNTTSPVIDGQSRQPRTDPDLFVAQFDGSLSTLVSLFFIGGTGADYATSLSVHPVSNDVYVAGYTTSNDFPSAGSPIGGADAVVVRLDSALGTLTGASRVGGPSADYANAMGIDLSGNIYLAGTTTSAVMTATAGVFPSNKTSGALGGGGDLFVAKLADDLSPLAVSLAGASAADYGYAMAIHSGSGEVYVAGSTSSTDFPLAGITYQNNVPSIVPPVVDPNYDGIIVRFDSDLDQIDAAYLGGEHNDAIKAIAVSPTGDVYVAGWTDSTSYYFPKPITSSTFHSPTFPTTSGAYDLSNDPDLNLLDRLRDVFVSAFDPGLGVLLASTLLGGFDGEEANGIAVDGGGKVFITGWTSSSGDAGGTPPIPSFPVTQGAYDSTANGEEDVFIVQFDSGLAALLASTFVGGESHDHGQAVALDNQTNVYVVGSTYSRDFPRVPELAALPLSYEATHQGAWDAFAVKFSPDFISQYPLTIEKQGTGTGTVTSIPTGIHCGTTCSKDFNYGSAVVLTATPGEDSTFAATLWSGGCIVTNPTTKPYECTATILSDTKVSVQFILKTFSIQTTADTGGTISPAGPVTVKYGESMTFTIMPDSTHYVSDLIVDGVSMGPLATYTFTNVTSDRTIRAIFRSNPVVNASVEPTCHLLVCDPPVVQGGAVSPSGAVTVNYGGSQTFSVSTFVGFSLSDVIVDGVSQGPVTSYRFDNVRQDHSIIAYFRASPKIVASADPGGVINPTGSTVVNYGGSQTFSMIPNGGNYLSDVIVDNASVGITPTYDPSIYQFSNVVADRTIRAVFKASPVIQTTADAGGTISPMGPVTVRYDESQTFSIIPNAGYALVDLIVNGVSTLATPQYSVYTLPFIHVKSDQSVRAVFRVNPVIQTTADAGGTISPTGPVSVPYGGAMTFSITANAGYAVSDVIVNGVSMGPRSSYVFTSVTSDQTIRAVFKANPVVQAVADQGGTISPSGTVSVQFDGSQVFAITPNAGFALVDLRVNNVSVLTEPKYAAFLYTLANIRSDQTIHAIFRANPVIRTQSDSGGTINPLGPVNVRYDGTITFNILPSPGYSVLDLLVNGVSIGPANTYTFTNVTSDQEIRATFRLSPVILASAETGGTITPSGPVTAPYGGVQSFSVSPGSGYYMTDVLVDGVSVGSVPKYGSFQYQFTNVTSDHTILAKFNPNPVITTTTGTGINISPSSGSVSVPYGGSQEFKVSAGSGYHLVDVRVDGVSIGEVDPYETVTVSNFTNVTANHDLTVSVSPDPVITASATTGGDINPSGSFSVRLGVDVPFFAIPDTGYSAAYFLVSGVKVCVGSSNCTISNVTGPESIQAVFTRDPVIRASASSGGSISPTGDVSVPFGQDRSFTANPEAGSHLAYFVVDGNPIYQASARYTFADVTEDHTIQAVFTQDPVIKASASSGGSITPDGDVSVPFGQDQAFTIAPTDGFFVFAVFVDGVDVGVGPGYYVLTYPFLNVTGNHTIHAVFQRNPRVEVVAGAGGRVEPEGTLTAEYGADLLLSIIPDPDNYLIDVLVDGISRGPWAGFNLENITKDHSVLAVFIDELPKKRYKKFNYVIQSEAGPGGRIRPEGDVQVQPARSKHFSIKPAKGYRVADVIIDGISWGPIKSYYFPPLRANHRIRAVFTRD